MFNTFLCMSSKTLKLNRGKRDIWICVGSEGGLTFPEVRAQSVAPQRTQAVDPRDSPKPLGERAASLSHLLPLRVTQAWVAVVATVTSSVS